MTHQRRLLARHQASAILATTVDFAIMITLVQVLSTPAPLATLASAAFGASCNFTLSRTWAYRGVHQGAMADQVVRYGAVAGGSAVLNALLMALLLQIGPRDPGLYVPLRVAISLGVSVLYAFPMHTRFVFRVRTPDSHP